ncbi:aspartate 1-decarboxylase (plasmid) [Bradyrhizobium sp. 62B]|uniref:aspartate 1-decarboxylase n=1 Tax=Bradyrhizobium sp. 62B TaxID=2898442 RepID=UPI003251149F|nr:aspartate 1-decarboxylase [Bradyrhizobium sp. 62B]
MQVTLMKGTIHRVPVTDTICSMSAISIDRALVDAAEFLINERVKIYNMETEARNAHVLMPTSARQRVHSRPGVVMVARRVASCEVNSRKRLSLTPRPSLRQTSCELDRYLRVTNGFNARDQISQLCRNPACPEG